MRASLAGGGALVYDEGTMPSRNDPATQVHQHSERSVPEETAHILVQGRVAHVGFIEHGLPYVIPFSYHFNPAEPDRLYLHGGTGGRARQITEPGEKQRLFERMIARYFPGRTAGRDYENAPPPHLDTTAVLEIALEGRSAKARRGGPKGPRDADPGAPGTSGVVDLREPE